MSTADMYDELEVVVDHLNDEHRDTMLFVVRHLASRTHDLDATTIVDGRLTAITENGIGGMATDASGEAHEVIWRFEAPPSDIDEVRGHMFTMLAEARGAAGDDVPLTSLEQEFSTDSPIPTHLSSVVAVSDVNPHLRQITFGGLDAFESLGGDEFLYVLLPPAGRNELTVDESFSWTAYEEMSESERPLGAYYTVRRWRPDAGEVDMWFVLHDHAGPASSWAARAQVGDPVALWGPRRAFEPPSDTTQYVLVVDESGLGAAAAILDQLADHGRPLVQVIAETSDAHHTVDLTTWDGVSVRWVFRNGAAAGTGTALLDAVRDIDLDIDTTYAFGAAESRRITEVRKHLRHDAGMPAERVSMTGYWRRGLADT